MADATHTSQFTQTPLQLYQVAASLAQRANEAANTAREKLNDWKREKFRLDEWTRIMSNTHPAIWALVFVIVSICEYFFTRELYRDFLPQAPYVPAIGLVVLSVLISHFISAMLSSELKNLEFFEMRQAEQYKHLPDMDVKAKLKSDVTRNFIIGLVLFLAVGSVVFYLSFDRAGRELGAGRRMRGFGVQDLLPVVFYVFEVLSGIYLIYLFKQIALSMKVSSLYKEKETNIQFCQSTTRESVVRFEEAETKGFTGSDSAVAEDVHKAFYRNKRKDVSQEEEFIEDPAVEKLNVSFNIKKHDGTAINANVRITTEYNFAAKGATDSTGNISLLTETYEGDDVKELEIEFHNGTQMQKQVVKGPYKFNPPAAHSIIL